MPHIAVKFVRGAYNGAHPQSRNPDAEAALSDLDIFFNDEAH